MSWRPTALLATVAALVLSAAYLDWRTDDPQAAWETIFEEPLPTPASNSIQRLLDFDAEDVVELLVERGRAAIHTKRSAYGWSGIANPRAVNDFLLALKELAIILPIAGPESEIDADSFGLVQPQGRVRLGLHDGNSIELTFGSHNPSATGIYARIAPPPRFVLTGAVALWDLDKLTHSLVSVEKAPPP